MHVRVKAFGILKSRMPGQTSCELAPGSSLADLLAELGIPWHSLAMVRVNGVMARREAELRDGDAIDLIPPIGGG